MTIVLSAALDRTSIRPSSTSRLALAIEIAAHGVVEGARQPSRTVLAIDVSGSMRGEPLDQVIRSVDRLLEALGEEDELGVVAFSDNATKVVDLTRVDPAGKRLVRSRVARLTADARTNIESGLNLAASMIGDRGGVILLSDGAPNVGAHTADLLRDVVRRHRPHVSFFALGYGVDHAEDVLAAVGEVGGGGYEFVPDPATCARAFARALGTQSDVVASGIELVIAPEEGTELARFVGREQTRFSREGVVVALPDMIGGARRLVVAELAIRPPGERFLASIVRVTLRSKDSSFSEDIAVEVADRDPVLVPEAARRVLLARADERREEARSLADRGQFGAAANSIRALMREIEALPGWIAGDGSALGEAYELLVDEAMAFERKPSIEEYAAFRKAAVGAKLVASAPMSARDRGDASQKLIEHIAGDCLPAWLVGNGVRHPLREECVIGRTSGADIRVASDGVSRRHAEVFANAGDYWIADLGSTNPTIVNGQSLGRAPHKLVPGDVVKVGDVVLTFESEGQPA